MKSSLTDSPVDRRPLSESEKRVRNARRMRSYRQANRGMVEARVVDRMLVEAVALHLDTIDRREAKGLLDALFPLVLDGLVHRGHDKGEAARSIDRRLRVLVEGPDHQPVAGFVRLAAKEKAAGRQVGGFFQRTQ